MNTFSKTLSVAILGCGVAVSAFAATSTTTPANVDKAQQRSERMAKMQAQQTALFQQADSNKDGKLSATEFAKFNTLQKAAWEARKQEMEKNRFARLDANKDGSLSMDELKTAQAKRASFKHHHKGHRDMPKPAV
ncbi:MAG: EF-hand domain-containing protein [Moraxellaceae bacterium]|nr:MAG: EF-hand domain-containing protein [Moraxellaceae bacterium]